MMEFEKPSLGTTAIHSNKCTMAFIPSPHFASHRRRHVTPARIARRFASGSGGLHSSSLLEILQQARQSPVEDDGRVAIRHGMPQQILYLSQLVMGFAGDRDLKLVAIRSQRRDDQCRAALVWHWRKFSGRAD